MNDTELDELLDTWSAPPVPPSLRDRVRAGFIARPQRRTFPSLMLHRGKGLVAGAILAAAAVLLIVTQAFPQPTAPIPWSVESEFIRYADDGSSSIEMQSTSYESNGNEILLSRSMPGDPFKTAIGRTLDVTLPAVSRLHMRLLGAVNPEMVEMMERTRRSRPPGIGFISACDSYTGCLLLDHYGFTKAPAGAGDGCVVGEIVDRATILNYPTAAVRQRWTEHGRMTVWMAPGLGCFALRVTYEEERPDGTFHLVAAKQALKVTINP